MSQPKFSKGDTVVKKAENKRVDRALPHGKLEILGVLEEVNEGEKRYMIPRGRPVKVEKIDRNYELKDNSASDD
jgi:hypothetical protein